MSASETIACRCEDVTLADLVQALDGGAGTVRDLKLRTRIGMGACQGRTCQAIALSLVTGPRGEALSARPPARPVTLATLEEACRTHGG